MLGEVLRRLGVLAERLRSAGTRPGAPPAGRAAGRLARRVSGGAGTTIATAGFDAGPLRWWVGYGRHGLLTARVQRRSRVVVPALSGGRLEVFFPHRSSRPDAVALISERDGREVAMEPSGERWVAELGGLCDRSVPTGPQEARWRVVEVARGGRRRGLLAERCPASPTVRSGADRACALTTGVGGAIALSVRRAPHHLSADVDETSGVITLSGDEAVPGLRLRHEAAGLVVELDRTDPGVWRLRLGALRRYGTTMPLRPGDWHLESAEDGSRPLVGPAERSWTWEDRSSGISYRIRIDAGGLRVRSLVAPRLDQTWSSLNRARSALARRRAGRAGTGRRIVYECLWGRQVSGNPRALVEPLRRALPDADHRWTVEPGYGHAPPGTEPLIRWSPEWHDALAGAGLVVTNAALPNVFRRRSDQQVLQTWHGTPLKRIGLDMLSFEHMSPGYERDLRTQSRQWTHLLAPNRFCAEVYPRAFAYEGPLLTVGSPRNDLLLGPADPPLVERVRRALGIADGQRVVLFAPTFRDSDLGRRQAGASGGPDLEALGALGDGVTLLYRAHDYVADAGAPTTSRVRNVSDYPDIAELYLIADVLVTDYSSVMFDFALTGRPIVYYCPDLEHYRDELRGWYFDLEATAPGPITADEAALAEALAEALELGVPAGFGERYRAFRERYGGWERGDAADRVAERLATDVRW